MVFRLIPVVAAILLFSTASIAAEERLVSQEWYEVRTPRGAMGHFQIDRYRTSSKVPVKFHYQFHLLGWNEPVHMEMTVHCRDNTYLSPVNMKVMTRLPGSQTLRRDLRILWQKKDGRWQGHLDIRRPLGPREKISRHLPENTVLQFNNFAVISQLPWKKGKAFTYRLLDTTYYRLSPHRSQVEYQGKTQMEVAGKKGEFHHFREKVGENVRHYYYNDRRQLVRYVVAEEKTEFLRVTSARVKKLNWDYRQMRKLFADGEEVLAKKGKGDWQRLWARSAESRGKKWHRQGVDKRWVWRPGFDTFHHWRDRGMVSCLVWDGKKKAKVESVWVAMVREKKGWKFYTWGDRNSVVKALRKWSGGSTQEVVSPVKVGKTPPESPRDDGRPFDRKYALHGESIKGTFSVSRKKVDGRWNYHHRFDLTYFGRRVRYQVNSRCRDDLYLTHLQVETRFSSATSVPYLYWKFLWFQGSRKRVGRLTLKYRTSQGKKGRLTVPEKLSGVIVAEVLVFEVVSRLPRKKGTRLTIQLLGVTAARYDLSAPSVISYRGRKTVSVGGEKRRLHQFEEVRRGKVIRRYWVDDRGRWIKARIPAAKLEYSLVSPSGENKGKPEKK